jgi:hypothetical protein
MKNAKIFQLNYILRTWETNNKPSTKLIKERNALGQRRNK